MSTHNKEGGRNKVRVERGKGGKRKKRKKGGEKEAGRSCYGGPCSHLSPVMKMGEGPLQY